MTRVVALDTSTWWGSVALVEGGDAPGRRVSVAEAGLRVTESHAVHVLALLDVLLREADWSLGRVDAFAATRGPGSFTGIRVGLGTIRGLGIASGRPCIGIGTLEALAEALGPADAERVPLIPAGRGEVYGARYDPGSTPPVEIVPPWLGEPRRVFDGGRGVPVVFGPGADAETLREAGRGAILRDAPPSIAAATGRLALLRLGAGALDGEGMSPVYLRPPDAEVAGARG